MGAAGAGPPDPTADGASALHLVRAAAVLRWRRPDLTATLAELALETATDAATWIGAAGWLLHGRAALGDGRQTACDLLDGLGRWGATGDVLMTGPVGRRLRVELAGPARRIGEPGIARALLSADPGLDDGDADLRADVLTELARCAVDDAPGTADDALRAADRAWRDAACPPGVGSVMLLSAARQRRAGNADEAITQAVDGLRCVNAGGRRAGATASDHVAAALTAEWIAALTEAGKVEEACADALPAAHRLITVARTSRQIAGLRLALARVTAVADSPEAVLAALEAAAGDAADSDVPELEAACRTMLGGLHESAGRLDAALGALRAAMAAEHRDRDRSSRLRARLAAVAATWAATPSRGAGLSAWSTSLLGRDDDALGSAVTAAPWGVGLHTAGAGATVAGRDPSPRNGAAAHGRPAHDGTAAHATAANGTTANGTAANGAGHDSAAHGTARNGTAYDEPGAGRRARRLAGQADDRTNADVGRSVTTRADHGAGDRSGAAARDSGAHNGHREPGPARRRAEDTGRSGAVPRSGGAPSGNPSTTSRLAASPHRDATAAERWADALGGSLIGDALLREFAESAAIDLGARPSTHPDGSSAAPDRAPGIGRGDAAAPADDPLFVRDPGRVDGRATTTDRPNGRGPRSYDHASPDADEVSALDRRTTRGTSDTRPDDPSSIRDTVVLGILVEPGTGGAHDAARPGNGVRPDRSTAGTDGGSHRTSVPGSSDTPTSPDGSGGTDTAEGPAAPPPHADEPGPRSTRHGASGRGAGRPPSTDTDGLGLADLLAGALAAYRNL